MGNIKTNPKSIASFGVKDCALVALSTGRKSQNLRELRDNILTINQGSLYFHFWGGMLRPQFGDPEYKNDFAAWAKHGLNDARLAEKLGAIIPTEYQNLEDLRHELIEIIEERLDESEFVPWSRIDQQFYFIHSQIVVFDTHQTIPHPEELPQAIANMTLGSIFYHFIDAQRRYPLRLDDFCAWLQAYGEKYQDLINHLVVLDPYFSSLSELRQQLTTIIAQYFGVKINE